MAGAWAFCSAGVFLSTDALDGCSGFLVWALDVAGVVSVEVLDWLCAIPSAAANRVSAMVFMISSYFYLVGSQRHPFPNGVAVTTFFIPSTMVPSGDESPARQPFNPPPTSIPGPDLEPEVGGGGAGAAGALDALSGFAEASAIGVRSMSSSMRFLNSLPCHSRST